MNEMRKILLNFVTLLFIIILLCPKSMVPESKKYLMGPTEVHKKVYVSSDFDQHELSLIKQAAEEWKVETHGLATFEVNYGFDSEVYESIIGKSDSMVVTKSGVNEPLVIALDIIVRRNILGYFITYFKVQTILLVPDRMIDDDYYRAVIIHEMGHSIGLSHLNKEETIMHDSMDETYHLTKTDIRWFCRAYYCDLGN